MTLARALYRTPRGGPSAASHARSTGKRCADASHPPAPWCVFGRPVVGSISPSPTPQPRLSTRAGSTRPGRTSSTTSARVPGLMYSRLFSRTKASSHTRRESRKVSAGCPAAANCPMLSCRLVTTPSPGARRVVRGEIEACLLERGQRLADLRIVGALWAERLARLLQRGLGTLHLRLGRVQLRPRLIAFRLRIDANAHQLEDPRRLLANVVP